MSKQVALDNALDSNLKPLKIGDKLTGIELSDDNISIRNSTSIDKTLSLGGSIKFEKDDPGINFGNQLSLQIDTSSEQYIFYGTVMSLSGGLFDNHANTDVKLLLQPDGTGDSVITFYEDNVSTRFSIGHDATDTTFQIVSGATIGTNTLLSMAQTGAKTFNCTDGNTDLKLTSSANVNDYCSITIGAEGVTTIATVDADTEAADLTLDVDGDITLDSGTGVFIAKKAGTEFSVANSAYAGMILGYQLIGESAVHATYTFTTSYAVPTSAMNVKFVAPPSGAVEITVQFGLDGTAGRYNAVGLSDNATYNSLGNSYEQSLNVTDETDRNTMQHLWVITGLTAGTAYQYWLGVKSTHASGTIQWGGTSAGRYVDFIMKAVALPAATADYAVYN